MANVIIKYGTDFAKSSLTHRYYIINDNKIQWVDGLDAKDIVAKYKYVKSFVGRGMASSISAYLMDKSEVTPSPESEIPDDIKQIDTGIIIPDPKKGKIVKEETKLVEIDGKKGVIKITVYEAPNGDQTTVTINTATGTETISPPKKKDGLKNLINIINAVGTASSIISGIKSFTSKKNTSGSNAIASVLLLTDSSGESYLVDPNSLSDEALAKLNKKRTLDVENGKVCPRITDSDEYSNYDPGCSLTNYLPSESPAGSLFAALSMFNGAKGPADVFSALDWTVKALDYSKIEPHAGEGDNGKASFANCIPKIPSFASLLSKLGQINIPKIPTLPSLPGIPLDDLLGFIPELPELPKMPDISKILGLDNLKCPPGPEDIDKDKVSILEAFKEADKAKSLYDSVKSGNVAQNVIGVLMAQQCTKTTGGGRIDKITGKPIFDENPEEINQRCISNMETLKNLSNDLNTIDKLKGIVANAKDNPLKALIDYDLLQKNQYNDINNTAYTPSSLQRIADAVTFAEDSACIFGSFKSNPLEALVKYEKLQTLQEQQTEVDKIKYGL